MSGTSRVCIHDRICVRRPPQPCGHHSGGVRLVCESCSTQGTHQRRHARGVNKNHITLHPPDDLVEPRLRPPPPAAAPPSRAARRIATSSSVCGRPDGDRERPSLLAAAAAAARALRACSCTAKSNSAARTGARGCTTNAPPREASQLAPRAVRWPRAAVAARARGQLLLPRQGVPLLLAAAVTRQQQQRLPALLGPSARDRTRALGRAPAANRALRHSQLLAAPSRADSLDCAPSHVDVTHTNARTRTHTQIHTSPHTHTHTQTHTHNVTHKYTHTASRPGTDTHGYRARAYSTRSGSATASGAAAARVAGISDCAVAAVMRASSTRARGPGPHPPTAPPRS